MKKVAVTTSDGKQVDVHFGKATCFYIYNIDHNKVSFVEKRFVNAYCSNSDQINDGSDHEYKPDNLVPIISILRDCDTLYTQQIGEKPLLGLVNQGMHVQTCNCNVDQLAGCGCKCNN